jgi:hypothetical protein
MRKLITVAAGIALAGSLSACGKSGMDRAVPMNSPSRAPRPW